jgi:hypothetical protein
MGRCRASLAEAASSSSDDPDSRGYRDASHSQPETDSVADADAGINANIQRKPDTSSPPHTQPVAHVQALSATIPVSIARP